MLKALIEKRNALVSEMEGLVNKAVEEARAVSEEEDKRIKEIEEEVRGLDGTIERAKKKFPEVKAEENADGEGDGGSEGDTEGTEVRAFADYVRGSVEHRDDANFTKGANGDIIPKTIGQMIIKKAYDVCPILADATVYTVKGQLDIPVYDESDGTISFGYADEFVDLAATSAKFTKITLTGYLAGTLTKISKSLLNSTDIDLVNFIVADIAEKVARFFEKEVLNGTAGKITGLSTVAQKVTAASATAVTADELIDVCDSMLDTFKNGAYWVMSRSTRTAIRKLKDSDGRYLLNDDVTSRFGSVLLGYDVYVTDNMPDMAASKTAAYFVNPKGLAVKFTEQPETQVLLEKFATQHAIGVTCWAEMDAKIQNNQMVSALVMAAA